MIATCSCLQKLMSDPAHSRCIVNAVQQGHTRRRGSATNFTASTASLLLNSAQARARAPPTSNRSATTQQLQDDNTNDDIASAVFTDEEGSVGPDFQWAHVLALDMFMNGLHSRLQTSLLEARCQLAWMPMIPQLRL